MIELIDLSKRFGPVTAVDGVSLTVASGELVGLLGGSGSGKSTTLQMVNRLVAPSGGSVRLFGEPVERLPAHLLRRQIGYCFQGVGLFPHLSVGANIAIPCQLQGWEPGRIAAQVEALLTLVELPPAQFRDRLPAALSGGQQQRIGVARALAAGPKVMLFDEPFGALDPLIRARLQQSLQRIRRELQLTGIFVTHDVVEALTLCDRVAVMRDGKLLQVDTPQALLQSPVDAYVADLIRTPLQQAQALQTAAAPPLPLALGA